jgi:hypothetical protein
MKADQADYEQTVKDSANKRTSDAKSPAVKQGAKADAEAARVTGNQEHTAKTAEAMADAEYIPRDGIYPQPSSRVRRGDLQLRSSNATLGPNPTA